MTGNAQGGTGDPQQPAGTPSDEQLADAAVRRALTVPGVLRLQPGLKHAVGRAARALFASGNPDDHLAAATSGVDVSRTDTAGGTVIEVTLRVITAADPRPRVIASTVRDVVMERLVQLTDAPVAVVVVIVDVEDVDVQDVDDEADPARPGGI